MPTKAPRSRFLRREKLILLLGLGFLSLHQGERLFDMIFVDLPETKLIVFAGLGDGIQIVQKPIRLGYCCIHGVSTAKDFRLVFYYRGFFVGVISNQGVSGQRLRYRRPLKSS